MLAGSIQKIRVLVEKKRKSDGRPTTLSEDGKIKKKDHLTAGFCCLESRLRLLCK